MRGIMRFRRLVRGLWPDRNPLRRRSDRAEAALVAGLLAGLLAGAPTAAITAGGWAYSAGIRAEHAQRAWHQAPAMLLETAHAPAGTAQGYAPGVQVQARWTAPDGTPRIGEVTVSAGAAAHSTLLVWTDAAGRLQGPPLRHGTVITLARRNCTGVGTERRRGPAHCHVSSLQCDGRAAKTVFRKTQASNAILKVCLI